MTGMKNVSDLSDMNFQDISGFHEEDNFIRVSSESKKTIMSKGTDSFLENRTFHFGKITVSNGKLYDTVYKKRKRNHL